MNRKIDNQSACTDALAESANSCCSNDHLSSIISLIQDMDLTKRSSAEDTCETTNQDDDLGNRDLRASSQLDLVGREEALSNNIESNCTQDASVKSAAFTPIPRRRPRPSLSERTIETLSQIPPSPSPRHRKSGFNLIDPVNGSVRPTSSLSLSRSIKLEGQYPSLPSTRGISPKRNISETTSSTPNRRSASSFIPRSLPRGTTSYGAADLTPSKVPPVPKVPSNGDLKPSKSKISQVPSLVRRENDGIQGLRDSGKQHLQNPKYNIVPRNLSKSGAGAKTYSPISTRHRPALSDIFPTSTLSTPITQKTNMRKDSKDAVARKASTATALGPEETQSKLSKLRNDLSQSSTYNQPTSLALGASSSKESPKSSAALRETIAKAKASRRAAIKNKTNQVEASDNEHAKGIILLGSSAKIDTVLSKRFDTARTSGRLNIAALGLAKFPTGLKDMYNLENIKPEDSAWYESVDMVRLIAADNEFEELEDWVFPDISAMAISELDDDFGGNTFGGLETIDLHGNRLASLPKGLRRLERLKTLNLSKNRLTNECLGVVSQIGSLRELYMGDNLLKGEYGESLSCLSNLQILDIHDNDFISLFSNISELSSLRTLLVAGNKLCSISFDAIQHLPLVDIDAARNRLNGALLPESIEKLYTLKSLDVSHNSLSSISEREAVSLPSLEMLNVTENRLSALPNVLAWQNLTTLLAGGNSIVSIPPGLTSLPNLKDIDFSRNSLTRLENDMGLMENLVALRVGNNPLRERQYLSMDTEDLKRHLRERILPEDLPIPAEDELVAELQSTSSASLPPIGVLDLSRTKLQDLSLSVLASNPINTLLLHHNLLSCVPSALASTSFSLTTLSLSHNKLSGSSYLPTPLSLAHLKYLDLSSNSLSTLTPLLSLSAPLLSTLTVNANRLTHLPPLRNFYPCLTTFIASHNRLTDLDADAVRGLHVIDVSGNEIARLDPKLGLLAQEGLRTLNVGANLFRVPRREVVEKGTGALLEWLRGRIPVEE